MSIDTPVRPTKADFDELTQLVRQISDRQIRTETRLVKLLQHLGAEHLINTKESDRENPGRS